MRRTLFIALALVTLAAAASSDPNSQSPFSEKLKARLESAVLAFIGLAFSTFETGGGARASNTASYDAQVAFFASTNQIMVESLWAARGFLLGFGWGLLKVIVDQSRGEKTMDYDVAFKFAKMAGLGTACFLVGGSILVPAQWRHAALSLKT